MSDRGGNDDDKMTTEVSFPELGHSSLQEFIQAVFKNTVQSTQCSNTLPAITEEHGYWESFDDFKDVCAKQGTRILNNIGDILQHSAVQCKWGASHLSGKSTTDIEEQFEKLVDANDILLENVGLLLDEASGIKKKNEAPVLISSTLKPNVAAVSSWNKKKDFTSKNTTFKLLLAKNIHRPQLNWLDKIDNRNIPFIPYLKYKPNALKPLEVDGDDSLGTDNFDDLATSENVNQNSSKHPYYYELSQFEAGDWQLEMQTPKIYLPLDETALTIVDSEALLDQMMVKLRQAKEIGVDLEHHSYRSFLGFVCLIQVSTRTEDFIIDSLKLRDELCVLNEVFTDPSIVKVLHGSDADIGWLQRDFGVYMVNMFDTGQAARALHETRFSLSHLLQKYCDVTAQKQYQLADWRIRPLPEEMLRYAREDTHYILYIYDVLRNELISRGNEMKNLLRSVYTRSTHLCASLYVKPRCEADSHLAVYRKYRKRFNPQQLECFRLLYGWRDHIARQEDESTGYVLPNHMMFQIAEALPRDQQGVIALCNPVPPLVNQHIMEIHRLVMEAKEFDPVQMPAHLNNRNDDTGQADQISKDIEITKFQTGSFDARSGFEIYEITGPNVSIKEPSLSVFDMIVKEQFEINAGKKKAKELLETLRSPFEMYLPNTGKEAVDPKEIIETWQTKSKEKIDSEEAPPVINIDDSPPCVIKKKKRIKHGLDDELKSLREMLPKKSKSQKPLSEHLDELIETAVKSGDSVPMKLDYEKNVKHSIDFVPFDYSKADLKKFTAGKSSSNAASVNLEKTEEPNVSGPVKTKIHSGARQMTF